MAFYQNIDLDWTTWKEVETKLTSNVYYLQNDLQYVPFVIDTINTIVYFSSINRDPSSVNQLSSGAAASKVIQDITFTANALGTAGNSITIQYVNDATGVGKEFVTVAGNAITVHIVSGQSTAQQVVTAAVAWSAYNSLINHSAAAAALISAVVSGASGKPQTTQGPTALTGGIATVTVISDWQTNFQGSAIQIGSFMDGVGAEVAL